MMGINYWNPPAPPPNTATVARRFAYPGDGYVVGINNQFVTFERDENDANAIADNIDVLVQLGYTVRSDVRIEDWEWGKIEVSRDGLTTRLYPDELGGFLLVLRARGVA